MADVTSLTSRSYSIATDWVSLAWLRWRYDRRLLSVCVEISSINQIRFDTSFFQSVFSINGLYFTFFSATYNAHVKNPLFSHEINLMAHATSLTSQSYSIATDWVSLAWLRWHYDRRLLSVLVENIQVNGSRLPVFRSH
jgi:hypothetical protein